MIGLISMGSVQHRHFFSIQWCGPCPEFWAKVINPDIFLFADLCGYWPHSGPDPLHWGSDWEGDAGQLGHGRHRHRPSPNGLRGRFHSSHPHQAPPPGMHSKEQPPHWTLLKFFNIDGKVKRCALLFFERYQSRNNYFCTISYPHDCDKITQYQNKINNKKDE